MQRSQWQTSTTPLTETASKLSPEENTGVLPTFGVHEGNDENGKPALEVVFPCPESPRRIQTLNCSSWLVRPEIGRAFAKAFYVMTSGLGARTRRINKDLINSFFMFLKATSRSKLGRSVVQPQDLRKAVFDAYIDWLDGRKKQDGTPLIIKDKQYRFAAIRRICGHLHRMPEYATLIDQELLLLRCPWYKSHWAERQPREGLSNDVLLRIEQACLKEIDKTMALIEEGNRLLEDNKNRVPASPINSVPYYDLGVCLAAVVQEFGPIIPKIEDIHKKNRLLAYAVKCVHKSEVMASRLYPSPRSLLPFAIMLAARTFFNPDTVLGLTWSQIRERNWFYGDERWDIDISDVHERLIIGGKKARSRKLQMRSFPTRVVDPDNPPVILRKLKQLTARLRAVTDPLYADRVFVYVPNTNGKRSAASYGNGTSPLAGDITWQHSLKRFIQDHHLPPFTLVNLRFTGSDLVHELTGGDVVAQQVVLNHRSPDTTHEHYTSASARQRNNESLARIQSMRVRWVATEGHRDVRGVKGLSTQRAVTPGFECLDPYDSPQPGQLAGKLCDAYLACPRCPLAVLHRRDPLALAQLLKLETAFSNSQFEVTPQRWIQVLAPLREAVQRDWLPLFAKDIWNKIDETQWHPEIIVE
jgi:hypothetical protein